MVKGQMANLECISGTGETNNGLRPNQRKSSRAKHVCVWMCVSKEAPGVNLRATILRDRSCERPQE
jgi:hypothetical protein